MVRNKAHSSTNQDNPVCQYVFACALEHVDPYAVAKLSTHPPPSAIPLEFAEHNMLFIYPQLEGYQTCAQHFAHNIADDDALFLINLLNQQLLELEEQLLMPDPNVLGADLLFWHPEKARFGILALPTSSENILVINDGGKPLSTYAASRTFREELEEKVKSSKSVFQLEPTERQEHDRQQSKSKRKKRSDSGRIPGRKDWKSRLLSRLRNGPGLLLRNLETAEDAELNPTQNLDPEESGFRMALLTQGAPGTIDETEGRRAFILVREFVIGRDSRRVDFALVGSSIGRVHARILRREQSFFLEDLGSANGTCIDDIRLHKYQEYLLPDRCRIRFADQTFYFRAD